MRVALRQNNEPFSNTELRRRNSAHARDLYPSKEALDGALAGMEGGMAETFEQLDELLVTLA
jgi:hypothetical protein